MEDKRFDEPVHVMVGGPGRIRVVTTTGQAADCLLNQWPGKPGRKHRTARQACLDVLSGIREARAARAAFAAAAEDADILVPIDRITRRR